MFFVKVPKEDGEKTRKSLIKLGIYTREYTVESKDDNLFFPVTEKKGEYTFVEMDGIKQQLKYFSLGEALSKLLTPKEMQDVITSFDVIGDIAIVEIPDKLMKKQELIAETLMNVHRNVKVVAKKTGAMKGKYRVRPLKVIAGENRTETLYTEHGVQMYLDPSKTYFSVRLSTERKRIANLVKPKEKILALFAGTGPFPLVISKYKPTAKSIAIELNPDGVDYLKRNITLNKATNVTAVLGDARKVVMEKYMDFANRVLMPLPKSAESFLDVAFAGVKSGGIVHIYAFAPVKDPYTSIKKKIKEQAKKSKSKVTFLTEKIVRPYAPNTIQVVIDFKVSKNPKPVR